VKLPLKNQKGRCATRSVAFRGANDEITKRSFLRRASLRCTKYNSLSRTPIRGAGATGRGALKGQGAISNCLSREIVTRRSKRTLNTEVGVVTYNVSFENGSQLAEDFPPPGGPYLALGQVEIVFEF
jgi:hypothetical protein